MKRFTISWLAIFCIVILITPNILTSEEMVPLPYLITHPKNISIPVNQFMLKVKQLMPFLTIKLEGWKPDEKNSLEILNHRIIQQYRAKDSVIQIDFTDLRIPPSTILLLGFPLPNYGDKFMQINYASIKGGRKTVIEGFHAIEVSNIKDKSRSMLINLNNNIIVGIAGRGLDDMDILNHVANIMKLKQIAKLEYPK